MFGILFHFCLVLLLSLLFDATITPSLPSHENMLLPEVYVASRYTSAMRTPGTTSVEPTTGHVVEYFFFGGGLSPKIHEFSNSKIENFLKFGGGSHFETHTHSNCREFVDEVNVSSSPHLEENPNLLDALPALSCRRHHHVG